MAPFEIVEHTADAGVRITAPDLETFFADAARGMFHLISDTGVEGWPAQHTVDLAAPDMETLLVDWLSELLYLFEVKKFFFEDVAFEQLEPERLQARVSGISWRGLMSGTEIKAVTHHMLEVSHGLEGYSATVYFDL